MARLIRSDGSETEIRPQQGTSFTLEEMQHYVGGYVQALRLPSGEFLLMDEDGKSKHKPVNRRATLFGAAAGTACDDMVVGDVVVCSAEEFD